MFATKPYAQLRYREIYGKRMAFIDEGKGNAIVFQHGQPTSSYVWRNVMPHLEGLGRLVACDLIGMGGSEKLSPSSPDRYHYAEHRDFLFALWEALDLGDLEAVAVPMHWSDLPEQGRPFFHALRSPEGEQMVLQDNIFIEKILRENSAGGGPAAVHRRGDGLLPAVFPQPRRRPQADVVVAPLAPARRRAGRDRQSRKRQRRLVC